MPATIPPPVEHPAEETLAQGLVVDFLFMPPMYVLVFGIGLTTDVFVAACLSRSLDEAGLFLFFSLLAAPLHYLTIRCLLALWRPPRSRHISRRVLATGLYVLACVAPPISVATGSEGVYDLLLRILRLVARPF